MFKKPASVAFKGETRLRGKEQKRLREALELRLGGEAVAEALLPSKADVLVKKVGGGSFAQFIFVDGQCFLIQSDSRDDVLQADLLPTLPALWRMGAATSILPVVVIARPVAKFIFRGSSVMAPGVHSVRPSAAAVAAAGAEGGGALPKIGQIVAVCCIGNPSACAVGRLKMPATSLAGGASKGEAVEVLHYFGDCLWEACGSPRPAGFVGDEVVATEEPEASAAGAPEAPAASSSTPPDAAGSDGDGEDGAAASPVGSGREGGGFAPPPRRDSGEAMAGASADADQGGGGEGEGEEAPSPEAMSKSLEECLLQAIKTRVKDRDLPITGNALYAQHLRPCRRAGSNIDVKASGFKKLAAFLAFCEENGWIALKRNSPEPIVTKIFRDHPDYREWKPWPRTTTAEAAEDGGGGGGGPAASIEVQLVWRANGARLKPLFESIGDGAAPAEDGCCSREELVEILRRYVDKKELWQANNRKRLAPDALLQGLLGGGQDQSAFSLDGIADKLLAGLKSAHRVAVPQGGAAGGIRRTVRDGRPPVVQVRTDTRKGHNVTLAHGLEAYGVDMDALAACLSKALATSVVVEEASPTCQPGIMVQGFWDVAVVDWLGKIGVPPESIQHQAKKGQTQKKAKQATNIVKR